MFEIEAATLKTWLAELNLQAGMRVLSIASGNSTMRQVHQPFIHEHVFAPLEQIGVRCIHHELYPAEGVEIAGDLNDEAVVHSLASINANVILCCNLLEHIADRKKVATSISQCVPPEGYLLVTVPRSFQYHADPIDTYYRPTPHELSLIFPMLTPVKQDIVVVESMWHEFAAGGGLGTLGFRLCRHLFRLLSLLGQPKRWVSQAHSTMWLIRKRKVTLLLLKRA